MSTLKQFTTDETIKDAEDRLGGNFGPWDSGMYPLTIQLAYLTKADSEAVAVNLVMTDEDGRELRNQQYISSGKDKGCKNYYEKDGEKHYLPGFNIANAICLLTEGKELSDMDTEMRTIKLYDYNARAEVPTKVEVLPELTGKEIKLGVLRVTVDKRAKDGAGVYQPTGETVDINEIDTVFRASDNLTVTEIRGQLSESAFQAAWMDRNTGKTRNKAKGATGGSTAGAPKGGAPKAAGTSKPQSSLFKKNA